MPVVASHKTGDKAPAFLDPNPSETPIIWAIGAAWASAPSKLRFAQANAAVGGDLGEAGLEQAVPRSKQTMGLATSAIQRWLGLL